MSSVKVSEGVTKVTTKQGSGGTPKKGATITVHCTGSVLESSGTKKKFWRYSTLSILNNYCKYRSYCCCVLGCVYLLYSTRDPGQKVFTFRVGLGEVIAGKPD